MTGLSPALLRRIDEQFAAIRAMPTVRVPASEQHRMTLASVTIGSYVCFQESTWRVTAKDRYVEWNERMDREIVGEEWFELTLFSLNDGSTVQLEWSEDDAIEACVTVRQLTFRDCFDETGEGIDEDDLDTIADDEDSVFCGGREYEYADDYPAAFHRAGKSGAELAYFYEFTTEDGMILTIEEWRAGGHERYALWLSRAIDPRSVTILSIG